MLLYHRCENLDDVVYGDIVPDKGYTADEQDEFDAEYKKAYRWLEKQIGFYPLFMAAGAKLDDIYMTGYQSQWRVKIVDSARKERRKYRRKGEFPNRVLFSFEDLDGVYTDYDAWHMVLNSGCDNYKMSEYEIRQLLKPSYRKSDWLRKTRKEPGTVQFIVPRLNLADAKRVWVRNKKTKTLLEAKGFENVKVKRIPIEGW